MGIIVRMFWALWYDDVLQGFGAAGFVDGMLDHCVNLD
jgi:hypothetical protein